MEYNLTMYKIYKFYKNKWNYVTYFTTYYEAMKYINSHNGIFEIQKQESVD
jgi:hypothetical protein